MVNGIICSVTVVLSTAHVLLRFPELYHWCGVSIVTIMAVLFIIGILTISMFSAIPIIITISIRIAIAVISHLASPQRWYLYRGHVVVMWGLSRVRVEGFPKRGYFSGRPNNKDYSIWGSIFGPPLFRETTISTYSPLLYSFALPRTSQTK